MSSDQMPAPGKIKLIKFPPPGREKTLNARGMPGGDVEASIWLIHNEASAGATLLAVLPQKKYFEQIFYISVNMKPLFSIHYSPQPLMLSAQADPGFWRGCSSISRYLRSIDRL